MGHRGMLGVSLGPGALAHHALGNTADDVRNSFHAGSSQLHMAHGHRPLAHLYRRNACCLLALEPVDVAWLVLLGLAGLAGAGNGK